jgi:hypothetical protein
MTKALRGVIAGALLLAVAQPVTGQESYRLDGRDVAVYNLAGAVEVVPGSGSSVNVTVMAGGADASRLSVEVGEVRGRMALRVIYPDDQIVYRPEGRGRFQTQLRVREDGTFGGGSGGDRVEIRSGGSGLEAYADLRIEVPAGTDITVHNAVGRVDAEGLRANLELDIHSGPLTAIDITGNVSLDTGSGSVTARTIRGELEIDTGSGSVDVNDVAGPVVIIDTGSGGVEGGGIDADRVEVDTGSGGITLEGVSAPDVTLDTGSGSVEVSLMEAVENLEIDTGSGRVTVRLPAGLNAEIEVDTGSGGIDVDFPVDVRTMRRNYFRGVAGNGSGRIVIDTGSGGIRLIGG